MGGGEPASPGRSLDTRSRSLAGKTALPRYDLIVTEGQALISPEVLARYAADAAREVEGVRRVVTGHLRRQAGVKVEVAEAGVVVHVPVALEYGIPIAPVAREVQQRVRQYLKVMADVDPAAVEVVVAAVELNER